MVALSWGVVSPPCLPLGPWVLLFSKVQSCCWKLCCWALKGGCQALSSLRIGLRLSCLFYLKMQTTIRREPLLIIRKICLGFAPVTCRSKASCPLHSPENRVYCCPRTPGTAWLSGTACFWSLGCSFWVSPHCHTLAFHIVFLFCKAKKGGMWSSKPCSLWWARTRLLHPLPSFQIVVAWMKLYLVVDLISLPSPAACLGDHLMKYMPQVLSIPCQPVACVAPVYEPLFSCPGEASLW